MPIPSPFVVELLSKPKDFDWLGTLLPFAGVVVGGLIAYFSVRGAEGRAAKRNDRIRWDDEIRLVSARAIAAARSVHNESSNWSSLCGAEVNDEGGDPDRERYLSSERSKAAYSALLETQGEMILIAPKEITQLLQVIVLHAGNMHVTMKPEVAATERDLLRPAITKFASQVRFYIRVDKTLDAAEPSETSVNR